MGEFLQGRRQNTKNQNNHQSQQTKQAAPANNPVQKAEAEPEQEVSTESPVSEVFQRKWDYSDGDEDNKNLRRGPVPSMSEPGEMPVQRKGPVPLQFSADELEEEPVQKKGPVPLQFQTSEEEEVPVQRKGPVQAMETEEEEEETVQRKGPVPAMTMEPEGQYESGSETASDKLPSTVQAKMETSFGEDFSDVNIHKSSSQSKDLNALAYTQGNNIHFAPGQYNPESQKGQELLGHELTHVVQQREGRVQPTVQKKGVGINDDKGLEKEADEMGEKAAKGIVQSSESTSQSTQPSGSIVQKQAANDPLKVDKGQITFDAEGNNDSQSRYYSRRAHWPGGPSGVTIGRGYDLAHRGSKQTIKDEFTSVGIDFSKFSGAVGLQGEEAQDWLKDNKDSLPEISLEQQEKLFNLSYASIEKDVKRISTKADVVEKYGEVNFDTLDPTIRDIIVDLRFRGDYYGETRKYVQEPMAKNDLQALYKVMKDKTKWKSVPEDRFNRRVKAIEAALGINGNANKTTPAGPAATPVSSGNQVGDGEYIVKSGESLEVIAAKFKTDEATIKNLNKDKLKQWPTKSGKVVEGFAAGDKIKVPKVQKPSENVTKSPLAEEKGFMESSFDLLNDAVETTKGIIEDGWDSFSKGLGSIFGTSSSAPQSTTPAKTADAKATPAKTETKTTAPAPTTQETDKKSIYSSQRDNKFSGTDIYGAGTKGGNVSADNMCNVTSLAMTLKSQASEHDLKTNTINLLVKGGGYDETKRAELMGYDLEDLIIRRFVQLGSDYFKKNVMGKDFKFDGNPPHQFGACLSHVGKQIFTGVQKTLDYYDVFDKTKYKNIAPELDKGNTGFGGTYLTGGHVVNLVKVVEDGLIINDPYGLILGAKSTYIKNGSKIADSKQKINANIAVIEKRFKYNSALLAQTKGFLTSTEKLVPHNMGENVFLDWDDVKTFSVFRWLVILKVK
ncbi:MAG: DUF4157 domain-containing protein [Sporocytophaga sp.]|uniref:pesticin C-terminus-like muramidase n=1 Tax=Sporocytophaga sp. TaxID=2231183 RepID=UPI001B102B6D|nr:pesticin C-terminus-like muramidase [Sporocytophaga sp.]MBO9698565.1 DUF4157 domain-containing protein [Sporocytophaga sp.]